MALFSPGTMEKSARGFCLQLVAKDRSAFPTAHQFFLFLCHVHNEYALNRHSCMNREAEDYGLSQEALDDMAGPPVALPLDMTITDVLWNPDDGFPEFKLLIELEYAKPRRCGYGFRRDGSYSIFYD